MAYSRKTSSNEIDTTRELVKKHNEFIAFDIETTGMSALKGDSIIEIGAVKIKDGKMTEVFHSMINPQIRIPYRITELTGISDEDVADSPTFKEVLQEFKAFVGETVLVAHNAKFDMGFIQYYGEKISIEFNQPYLDTLKISRYILKDLESHKLNLVANHLEIKQNNHHRADDDARVCGEIFLALAAVLCKEPEPKMTKATRGLKIKKISYWEKGTLKRIYVNGSTFTAFFDINKMEWVDKTNELDLELLQTTVCELLGASTCEEIANFRGTKSA